MNRVTVKYKMRTFLSFIVFANMFVYVLNKIAVKNIFSKFQQHSHPRPSERRFSGSPRDFRSENAREKSIQNDEVKTREQRYTTINMSWITLPKVGIR